MFFIFFCHRRYKLFIGSLVALFVLTCFFLLSLLLSLPRNIFLFMPMSFSSYIIHVILEGFILFIYLFVY